MAEYTSTRANLELTDIYVDTDKDGIYESLVLAVGATIPVALINEHDLQKSILSGSIARAVTAGWLTVNALTIQTVTITLNNGVVFRSVSNDVMFINGSLSATVTLV